MASTTVTDMVIKLPTWEPNPGHLHHRHTLYQLRYDGELKKGSFYWTYKTAVKKVENKIVYYKETMECLHLIFWPKSQRRAHYHTEKPEPNRNITIDHKI
jgi:hypothetical protein